MGSRSSCRPEINPTMACDGNRWAPRKRRCSSQCGLVQALKVCSSTILGSRLERPIDQPHDRELLAQGCPGHFE